MSAIFLREGENKSETTDVSKYLSKKVFGTEEEPILSPKTLPAVCRIDLDTGSGM
jgi:hypothetical protein